MGTQRGDADQIRYVIVGRAGSGHCQAARPGSSGFSESFLPCFILVVVSQLHAKHAKVLQVY
jgi:hypothetical protein